jgi:hypothetical protein
LLSVVSLGCGRDPKNLVGQENPGGHRAGLYTPDWGTPDVYPGRPVPRFLRSRRWLVIQVNEGICVHEKGPREPAPVTRFHHVRVRETSNAVYIAVFMRPGRPEPGGVCAGIGMSFLRRVQLRSPVRRRAVIDGGVRIDALTPIIYPALDRSIETRLERALAVRWARQTCSHGTLEQLQKDWVGGGSPSPQEIAATATDPAPPAARGPAYQACLHALRNRNRLPPGPR